MAKPDQDGNAEAAEAAEAAEEAADEESRGVLGIPKHLVAPVSVAVLAVVLAGVFCFVLYPPPAETPVDTAENGPILDQDLEGFEPAVEAQLPQIIVNLADEAREMVLKTQLTVRYRAADSVVVEEYLQNNTRTIKDALITHLSGKISTELKTAQGKELLKWELIDLLTPLLFPEPSEGKIMAVLFEEILFQ